MPSVVERVTVAFTPEGAIEYSVTYTHTDETPNPGTKQRITEASRMAAEGLRHALEGLDKGALLWGGFAQGRAEATDKIIVEGKEHT